MGRTLACLVLAAAALGCERQQEVSGQVFVVTRGKENIKLALVGVSAIPEKDMPEYLKAKHSNGVEQQRLLMPKLAAAEMEAKSSAHASELAENAFLADATGKGKLERSLTTFHIKGAKASAYQNLKREVAYFDSPSYYLNGLPTPAGFSKTDADGKFTLSVPSGKYVIAATTGRSVIGDTEHYYWLVRVDASSPVHSLMLSNDNQIETKCKECVLLPKD